VARTVPIIGVDPDELRWMRLLVSLLRHPDPSVPELARQALLYVTEVSRKCSIAPPDALPPAAANENQWGSRENLKPRTPR
jgi:hypothetical protein